MTDQTKDKAPRQGAEEMARDAAHLLGDTLKTRAGDFVYAVGEALRAGGDSLAKSDYGMAADCFDSAARRVEGFWEEVEVSGESAVSGGPVQPLGRRLRQNPTLAYGAALAAGFLVGAFLRAGFDEPAGPSAARPYDPTSGTGPDSEPQGSQAFDNGGVLSGAPDEVP